MIVQQAVESGKGEQVGMNPMDIFRIKSLWDRFQNAHPKFPAFLKAAAGAVGENSVIEISITTEDGRQIASNLKISAEDLQLFQELKGMGDAK